MTYDDLIELPPPQFKRACGVSRQTFAAMVAALRPSLDRRGKRGGQNTLSVENQLLLTLQYWREYRTQFHIGLAFGVSEATVSRTIAKVENLLAKSGKFSLPGKRQLLASDSNLDVVVVDVTEVVIERPQKNNVATIVASTNGTPSRVNLS
jgi:hypothetical protein